MDITTQNKSINLAYIFPFSIKLSPGNTFQMLIQLHGYQIIPGQTICITQPSLFSSFNCTPLPFQNATGLFIQIMNIQYNILSSSIIDYVQFSIQNILLIDDTSLWMKAKFIYFDSFDSIEENITNIYPKE